MSCSLNCFTSWRWTLKKTYFLINTIKVKNSCNFTKPSTMWIENWSVKIISSRCMSQNGSNSSSKMSLLEMSPFNFPCLNSYFMGINFSPPTSSIKKLSSTWPVVSTVAMTTRNSHRKNILKYSNCFVFLAIMSILTIRNWLLISSWKRFRQLDLFSKLACKRDKLAS